MAEDKSKSYDCPLKVIVIGDCVGKTCIMLKFSGEKFSEQYIATIGVDFRTRTVDINDEKMKLQIWDTAHQERFQAITRSYYRGTHGVMIVYDITNEKAFDNAVNKWMRDFDKYAAPGVTKMMVGNKCDLEESRAVSRERGQLVADDHGAMFTEVSAKAGYNIDEAFINIAREIYNKMI